MISILLIDDEPSIKEIGTALFESVGCSVTSTLNSSEALTIFQKQSLSFDLVITDYMRPDMRGDKLASALRFIRPEIPVFICSGHGNIRETELKNWGVDGLLSKPYEIEEIARLVCRTLRGKVKELAGITA
ncbi:MAG: response regulator [Desulfobacterales bacterium]|nr:response regulator [Desulfobacterales bacterium]